MPATPPLNPVHPKPTRGRHEAARTGFVAIAILALASLATAQEAPDSVTPEALAALVPESWQGLERIFDQAAIDSSGAAFASASFDDPSDERANTDLSLGLTDLGPLRDATVWVTEADVAAGRAERTELAGYPAYLVADESRPSVEVIADRIWIRARSFGPVYDLEALQEAVASLPLDEIAALSGLPVAEAASYDPTGFTRGGLRSFLPERVLGLARADGFFAELHPSGVAWSGFPYEGEAGRVRVTIWDLGTLADDAQERLASSDGWSSFTSSGRTGFVETGVQAPRVLLIADRFRIQVEARGGADVDPDWLRGALEEIDVDRLAALGERLPAPEPARDPLLGQPELADPEVLARALPSELAGMARGDVQAEVISYMGEVFDTASAQARYAQDAEGLAATLAIQDQGMVTHGIASELAGMRAVQVGDRTFYLADGAPLAITVVGDRVVVTLEAEPGAAWDDDGLVDALASVDLAQLEDAVATP